MSRTSARQELLLAIGRCNCRDLFMMLKVYSLFVDVKRSTQFLMECPV